MHFGNLVQVINSCMNASCKTVFAYIHTSRPYSFEYAVMYIITGYKVYLNGRSERKSKVQILKWTIIRVAQRDGRFKHERTFLFLKYSSNSRIKGINSSSGNLHQIHSELCQNCSDFFQFFIFVNVTRPPLNLRWSTSL